MPGARARVVVAVVVTALVAACSGGSSEPAAGGSSTRPTPGATSTAPSATPTPAMPLRAGERFVTVGVPGRYTPVARNGASDDYRCFLVDPRLAEDAFITGVQFLPDNVEVVHHAILYRVRPDQLGYMKQHDQETPGNGWQCFGDAGLPQQVDQVSSLDDAPWLAGWAPGGREQVYRGRLGVHVDAGSQIVLQVHYNLNAGKGPDATRVRLRMAPGDAPLEPVHTMLLVAPVELPCAPAERGALCDRTSSVLDLVRRFGPDSGATVAGLQLLCGGDVVAPRPAVTQKCDRTVREPLTVYAAAGHMHLLGKSISLSLNPGAAGGRTLLDIPVWDFDNQSAQPMTTPVRVKAGDRLRVRCTHDPGLRAKLPAFDGQPARYVTWGEGSTDEMCLGILLVTRP